MKSLFWILLAANLGLWMWLRWEQPPPAQPPVPVHPERIRLLSAPGVVLVPRLTSQSTPPAPAPAQAPGAPGPAPGAPGPAPGAPGQAPGAAGQAPGAAGSPAPPVPPASAPPVPAKAPRASRVSQAAGRHDRVLCLESSPLAPAALARVRRLVRQWQVRYRVVRVPAAVYQVLSAALTPHDYERLQARLAAMKVTSRFGFSDQGRRWISFGVFQRRRNADHEAALLRARGLAVHVVVLPRPAATRLILQPGRPLSPLQRSTLGGQWRPHACPLVMSAR